MKFDGNQLARLLLIPLFAVSILMIAGCSGCSDKDPNDNAAAKKKEEESKKRKPNFEFVDPVVLPGIYPDRNQDQEGLDEEDIKKLEQKTLARNREVNATNRVKLGHWVSSHYQAKANNFDARGDLVLGSVDARNQPIRITGTDYYLNSVRPASLPKGEWKLLETSIFLPRREITTTSANVNFNLVQSGSGMSLAPNLVPVYNTRLMLPFQYHFVLLSNRADAYKYLTALDSVQVMERSVTTGDEFPAFYSIVAMRPADPVPLPSHALNWTTTAYLLWDDFDANQLNTDQQTALLDWLHFGGQIIMSGPDCLDKLQNSFLADYLPAQFKQTRNLKSEDFAELNEHWAVPVVKNPIDKRDLKLPKDSALLGIAFTPHEESNFVDNTGELVIERQLGRGRIVMTAFSLDDLPVVNWRSFSSFFNGCLLRRPAREFKFTATSAVSFGWAEDDASIFDPLIGTTLRFSSRDLAATGTGTPRQHQIARPQTTATTTPQNIFNRRFQNDQDTSLDTEFRIVGKGSFRRDKRDTWHYGGYADDLQSGVAGWNDESGISVAARHTLKDAAGISPPNSGFVLKMLAGYLVVLVPLNWIVFRSIRRVEWAWIAAPVIAIAGAFVVAKMASLDIGFVRSNTQVGIFELHRDYSRGHLSEYSALYTSLSTNYAVELDNPSSQSLPFAANMGERFKADQTLSRVTLNRKQNNRMENFQIKSNSTGLLHTEHLLDVGGPVQLVEDSNGDWIVDNRSELNISNAGVLMRESEHTAPRIAWIGELAAGTSSARLEFADIEKNSYQEWASRSELFVSTERNARETWIKHAGEISADNLISVLELSEFPELAPQWTEIRQALQRKFPTDTLDDLMTREIGFENFLLAYSLAQAGSKVNVGRLFDAISDNLEIGAGEVRLIGSTAEQVGQTEFSPKSTQTDRQTLVLVHLRPAFLPIAKRDVNSMADIRGPRSSLDFDDEAGRSDNGAENSGNN